jgi:hypothetical protein
MRNSEPKKRGNVTAHEALAARLANLNECGKMYRARHANRPLAAGVDFADPSFP